MNNQPFLYIITAVTFLFSSLFSCAASTKVSPGPYPLDPDSRTVMVDGIRFHYKETGSGSNVILLFHGFGASVYSWDGVMEELARIPPGYRVIAYDRVPFGLTERPVISNYQPESNPYNAALAPRHAAALMDALGIKSAWLVGHSAGTVTAMETALQYPSRARGVILESPALYGGGPPPFVRFLLSVPFLGWLGPVTTKSLFSDSKSLLELAYHNPSNIPAGDMDRYRKPLAIEGWENALWEFSRVSDIRDTSGGLTNIQSPVLVIYGDDDRIVPTEKTRELSRRFTNMAFREVSECGHIPHEEKRIDFVDIVRGFILSNDAAPGR